MTRHVPARGSSVNLVWELDDLFYSTQDKWGTRVVELLGSDTDASLTSIINVPTPFALRPTLTTKSCTLHSMYRTTSSKEVKHTQGALDRAHQFEYPEWKW
ncbi:hypothetical protein Plhal304r1_c049g0131461 [Plasmopara halstedii]